MAGASANERPEVSRISEWGQPTGGPNTAGGSGPTHSAQVVCKKGFRQVSDMATLESHAAHTFKPAGFT